MGFSVYFHTWKWESWIKWWLFFIISFPWLLCVVVLACVCVHACMCGGLLRCTRSPLPVLRALSFLYIRKAFLARLICCFWNNFRWISSINGYSNIKNGRKNIKYCEFCVKLFYCDCLEIAKKLWLWWNIVYQLFETNFFKPKIFDITKPLSARKLLCFPWSYPSLVPEIV